MAEPATPKFYVNLPWPTHSYEQFKPCVVEATIQPGPYGDHLVVSAPPDFGRLTARLDEFGGWIECAGPAGLLAGIEDHLVVIVSAMMCTPEPTQVTA